MSHKEIWQNTELSQKKGANRHIHAKPPNLGGRCPDTCSKFRFSKLAISDGFSSPLFLQALSHCSEWVQVEALGPLTQLISQNHRMVNVGKSPVRSSSPTIPPELPRPLLNPVPKHHMYTSFTLSRRQETPLGPCSAFRQLHPLASTSP